ncbi:MAG: hypothetical protein E7262_08895 [Lachnospiraceae bacterium]|nr:hypothetical protein [Lachnospiraceae bacterium]
MKKLHKIICVVLSLVMIPVFAMDAYAASKTKTYVDKDNYLHRDTVTVTRTDAKKIVMSGWAKHVKNRDSITVSATKSRTQTQTASTSVSGKFSVEFVEITGTLGYSLSTGVTYTYSSSFTVAASANTGWYRAVYRYPGAKSHAYFTKEPNNPNGGGGGVMSEGTLTKLPPKKTVKYDKTVQYVPKKSSAYFDWEVTTKEP